MATLDEALGGSPDGPPPAPVAIAVARAEAGWLEGRSTPTSRARGHAGLARRSGTGSPSVSRPVVAAGRASPHVPVSAADQPFACWNRRDARARPRDSGDGLPVRGGERAGRERRYGVAATALAPSTVSAPGQWPNTWRGAAHPGRRASGASRAGGRTPARPVSANARWRCCELVAAGFTNPQIAVTLYIGRKTAEHHVRTSWPSSASPHPRAAAGGGLGSPGAEEVREAPTNG